MTLCCGWLRCVVLVTVVIVWAKLEVNCFTLNSGVAWCMALSSDCSVVCVVLLWFSVTVCWWQLLWLRVMRLVSFKVWSSEVLMCEVKALFGSASSGYLVYSVLSVAARVLQGCALRKRLVRWHSVRHLRRGCPGRKMRCLGLTFVFVAVVCSWVRVLVLGVSSYSIELGMVLRTVT